MTTLRELGEFGLIKRIAEYFPVQSENMSGIGDDCAILPFNDKENMLVTTDMLIENRHFLLDKITPYELGYKSLSVNLSDIAAMGGTPVGAFLSIGIPSKIDLLFIDRFFEGLKFLSGKTHTLLLGGDTTGSPDNLVINIAVIGKAEKDYIKRRSSAKPGDIVCVTGNLGDSTAGLKVLLENIPYTKLTKYFIRQHHMPRPHLKEGQWLSKQDGIRAMIDISDGVESDIHRIMESSLVGAQLEMDKLPVSKELILAQQQFSWNIWEIALNGGEDYCLMTTVDPLKYENINETYLKIFHHPLYKIGTITGHTGKLELYLNGRKITTEKHGFDHFKNM